MYALTANEYQIYPPQRKWTLDCDPLHTSREFTNEPYNFEFPDLSEFQMKSVEMDISLTSHINPFLGLIETYLDE